MSKKKKKKAGIGAIFARILVVILTMAVGGIASFFAVRQFFSYKFAKEKKKEVSQQLEKENKDRVDVALMQAGDMMTIRVYHSKNNQMVYIPLRSDMVLNLTDDGKRAVEQELGESVDTAEVSDVIKAMNDDGNTMKEQVEETLGITINSYELIKDDDLVDIINDAGTIQADLSQTISYEDQDGKSVTLTSGENTVDGDAVLALVSNEANIEDEDVHMKLIGDILVQASKTVTSKTSSDFENYVKNYYSKADSDISTEIDLRGKTVDEALHDLSLFIDKCVLLNLHEIRIIHGKGTGALRAAVQDDLRHHPNIADFRLGAYGEGESGVTIAHLK